MSASLAANQICRVIFAVISILVSIVPLCVLTRLAEFAATVFVADVILLNIFTLINASIWRNDDIDTWWDGSGFCDLQVFVLIPLECVYGACIFAIMRNLAQRLRLKRATELTFKERRRQMMYQALIIFPVPLIQLALTWFMLNNRYVVGTLVGCVGLYNYDWMTAIVLDIPLAIFPLATVPFAYLTWKRFHDISKTTQEALAANNEAAQRAQRTRRRLYGMALSIMVPYFPLQMAFTANNLLNTFRNYRPYDYNLIHNRQYPYPWDAILFWPSYLVPFSALNQPWIGILTAIPIVLFFGKNQEAKSMYQNFFVRIGLKKVTPTPATTDKGKELATRNTEATHNESVNLRDLPSINRQIVMSSSGPFIPPRRSFHSQAGPEIPPRGSSLRSWVRITPLQRIASSVRLPSALSTLFSTRGSTSNVSAVSGPFGTAGSGVGAATPVITLPLSTVAGDGVIFPFPEPLGPSARPSGEAPSSSRRSPPSSIWNHLSAHDHTERGGSAAAEEKQDDAMERVGGGFVRERVRSMNK